MIWVLYICFFCDRTVFFYQEHPIPDLTLPQGPRRPQLNSPANMLKVSRPRAPTRRGALISHLIAPLAPPCYGWSTRRRHHHHPTTLPTCLLLHSKTPQPSHPIRREMMIQRYWRPVKMTEALCAKTNAEIAKISAKHENDVKLSIPNRIHVANVIAAALSCLDEKCSTLSYPFACYCHQGSSQSNITSRLPSLPLFPRCRAWWSFLVRFPG